MAFSPSDQVGTVSAVGQRMQGQSVSVTVDPRRLRGVIAVIRAADRLANRVRHGDTAMLDSTIVEAARDYTAVRDEWKP